jgi:hypothetical protein
MIWWNEHERTTETTTESGETIGGYEPVDLQVVVGLLLLLQTISNPSNCTSGVWFEANLKTFVNWGSHR